MKIQYILRSVEGIRFIRFGDEDVVRHHLVQEIVQAFDQYDGRNDRASGGPPSVEGGEWQ